MTWYMRIGTAARGEGRVGAGTDATRTAVAVDAAPSPSADDGRRAGAARDGEQEAHGCRKSAGSGAASIHHAGL